MTLTTYANQRLRCAEHIYQQGGHYVLVEANLDLFGVPIVGGGHHDIRPIALDEALTIRLSPWQALRHVYSEANYENDSNSI